MEKAIEGYIEMVAGSDIKYVFDEEMQKLKLKRKTAIPLPEPFNYGFIKGTMGEDGDPLDVFVISENALELGSTLKLDPIGMLYVEDEMGVDNKIIAIPQGSGIANSIMDISPEQIDKLVYLLEHNKDGMEGRWTKVKGVGGKDEAFAEVRKAMDAGLKG